MSFTSFTPARLTRRYRFFSLIVGFFFVPLIASVIGCGGGGGSASTVSTTAPTRNYTGDYSGGVTLPLQRNGYFRFQVADDGTAIGSIDVLTNQAINHAALTGTVNQNDGSLALSGSYRDGEETIPVSLRGNLPFFGQNTRVEITATWHNYDYNATVVSGGNFSIVP